MGLLTSTLAAAATLALSQTLATSAAQAYSDPSTDALIARAAASIYCASKDAPGLRGLGFGRPGEGLAARVGRRDVEAIHLVEPCVQLTFLVVAMLSLFAEQS